MLSEYIKVVGSYGKKYVEPTYYGSFIMLIEVNKTGEQHYLSDRQAERVAKILYNEARKSFP